MASRRRRRQKDNRAMRRPPTIPRLSTPERLSKKEWKAVLRLDPCAFCEKVGPSGTVDHIIPKSELAEECDWDNFTGACPYCNNVLKADKPIIRFIYDMWTKPRLEAMYV